MAAADTIKVRITRPGALPVEVRGERNRWLVAHQHYGKNQSHAIFHAVGQPHQADVIFLDGRADSVDSSMRNGFGVKLNSTAFKLMAALVAKGIAVFFTDRVDDPLSWGPGELPQNPPPVAVPRLRQ
jgi:hypothetical protein